MRRGLFCLLVAVCAVVSAEDGARLLVITTDALYNSILPLAEWKQASGLTTKVVKLSETGSDTASIKNYIRNAWNTWPVKPEFVLLVGAPANLPSRSYRMMHNEYYGSDNIYGDVTGDYRMDVAVGRFPAKSAAQLDLMVAKTLGYERTPFVADTLWMRRMTTVCRDAGDDDAYTYWADIRNAISLAGSNGFVAFDSLASSRGHNQQSVVNSVSAGTGLVMYRGSATGNWYEPFAVNPAAPGNGWKLPVILSFTCATMTLASNESMVGEAWLKAGTIASPRGGVAFFGNTYSAVSVAAQRSAVCRGFTTGLFTEHKYRLGLSCIRAKEQLYQQFRSDTADYRGFNLLGDPTLDIWTGVPQALTVDHPAQIEPVPQLLHVVVTSATGPVDSAQVCASMDTTVYAVGYTNDSGVVDLDISPTADGSLRLVVTGHNLYPYDTVIPVNHVGIRTGEQPLLTLGQFRITPSPLRSDFATVHLNSSLLSAPSSLSFYDAVGCRVLRSPLDARNSSFSLDLRSLRAGAYLCVLSDGHGRTLGRTRIVKLD